MERDAMSYIDGNTGAGHKALTGGLVVAIQAGVALALIHGFTVVMGERDRPPRLTGEQIPLPTVPPPPREEPSAQPETPRPTPSFVDAPRPKLLIDDLPVTVAPQPSFAPSATPELGGHIFIPPVSTGEPPARFAPRAARPRNDVAGWVTTNDYPTAEIRAGHAGTVRFRLAVDASGRVTDCTIVESSGYPRLDEATCHNASRRARFDPASDGAGDRVAGSYTGSIRWVIPQD